jgi:hypothetical protein
MFDSFFCCIFTLPKEPGLSSFHCVERGSILEPSEAHQDKQTTARPWVIHAFEDGQSLEGII